MSDKYVTTTHVGDLLSGYLDGELTQQDRQRVRLHCESCAECAASLEEISVLRERVGKARISDRYEDNWRENMNDRTAKASRGIGWLLLIGGLLLAAGVGIYEFVLTLPSMSLVEKLIVAGIYGGMLLVFFSVLRQRLIERKTDKYKDVEI